MLCIGQLTDFDEVWSTDCLPEPHGGSIISSAQIEIALAYNSLDNSSAMATKINYKGFSPQNESTGGRLRWSVMHRTPHLVDVWVDRCFVLQDKTAFNLHKRRNWRIVREPHTCISYHNSGYDTLCCIDFPVKRLNAWQRYVSLPIRYLIVANGIPIVTLFLLNEWNGLCKRPFSAIFTQLMHCKLTRKFTPIICEKGTIRIR